MTRAVAFEDCYEVEPMSGCWIWTRSVLRPESPYGRFYWKGRMLPAHRHSYELHVGPIPDGLWVLHKCDNRQCVNPDHLYVGTLLDNHSDMDARGRRAVGLKHGMSKLTAKDVHFIRASGLSSRKVADILGVEKTAVRNVRIGKTWTHVPEATQP
jgi:hypothetical protein